MAELPFTRIPPEASGVGRAVDFQNSVHIRKREIRSLRDSFSAENGLLLRQRIDFTLRCMGRV